MGDCLGDLGRGQAVIHSDSQVRGQLRALSVRNERADSYEASVARRKRAFVESALQLGIEPCAAIDADFTVKGGYSACAEMLRGERPITDATPFSVPLGCHLGETIAAPPTAVRPWKRTVGD